MKGNINNCSSIYSVWLKRIIVTHSLSLETIDFIR